MKPTRPALALVLLALVVPSAASARTTFYVDDTGGSDANACTVEASPCLTIGGALDKASVMTFPGGDDIQVADGTYNEGVFLSTGDSGNVIQGGGVPGLFSPGTIIRHEDNGILSGAVIIALAASDVTFRDLEVDTTDGGAASPDPVGIIVQGDNARLERVRVDMPEDGSGAAAISLNDTATAPVLDRVTVAGDWDGHGIDARSPGASLLDSSIHSGEEGFSNALHLQGAITVRRSQLSRPTGGDVVHVEEFGASAEASLLAESTLIRGGQDGIFLQATASDQVAEAVLRHVTIDAESPGVANVGTIDAVQANETGAGTTTVSVTNSLLVEDATGGAGALITCLYTDVPGSVCPDGANTGNTSNPPSALFVNAPVGNWQLRPDSPGRDSGSPTGVLLGETTLDRLQNPRIVDGDFDCAARTDKGAYEMQDQANTPPANVSIEPGAVTAGQPAALSATAADQDPPGALSYAWTFSDGGTASGAGVSHGFPEGTHTVTVTATDTHGCSGSGTRTVTATTTTPPPPLDRTAPAFSSAGAFPPAFAALGAGRRAQAPGRRRVPRGTQFRFRLSEAARVTIVIERARTGRRVRGRCVRPTRANRRRPRCTRWPRATVLTVLNARPGLNTRAFSGRVGRRALAPGRYRARFLARDAAGNQARQRIAGFRVLRG